MRTYEWECRDKMTTTTHTEGKEQKCACLPVE